MADIGPHNPFLVFTKQTSAWAGTSRTRRLFKKAVQQGRSEQRGESYSVPYVEPLSDARTPLAGFFNSLLARAAAVEHEGHRSIVQQLDLHVRGKDPGFHVGTVVS